MFAIVELNGEQYRIDPGMKTLRVQYLGGDAGAKVSFDKVLFTQADNGDANVGGKAKIGATIASHGRDEKIVVFKKKRRKRYRVTKGHRQDFTVLNISEFSVN
jgi:large subunit ribosomal protein L21